MGVQLWVPWVGPRAVAAGRGALSSSYLVAMACSRMPGQILLPKGSWDPRAMVVAGLSIIRGIKKVTGLDSWHPACTPSSLNQSLWSAMTSTAGACPEGVP